MTPASFSQDKHAPEASTVHKDPRLMEKFGTAYPAARPAGTPHAATLQAKGRRNEFSGSGICFLLERAKRFELSTPTLARLCSTPELRPHPEELAAVTGRAVGISGRLALCKTQKQSGCIAGLNPIPAAPRGSGRAELPGPRGRQRPRGWPSWSPPW